MFSYNVSKLEDKLGVGSDTFCSVDQFHFVLTEKTDTVRYIFLEIGEILPKENLDNAILWITEGFMKIKKVETLKILSE